MPIYKGKAADYFYEQKGQSEAIIFAHGLFVNRTIFESQVESLQANYTCYSFDLPGHGKSTFNPDGWTLEDISEDFKQFIIDNDIKKPTLVGLSQGGMVFLRLAADHPELIGRLILVGSSHLAEYPDRIPLWKERIETFRKGDKNEIDTMITGIQHAIVGKDFIENHPTLCEKELQLMKSNNYQAMIPATEAAVINRTDVRDKLEKITCQTLIVVGTEDHATPIEIAEQMKSNIQNASLAIIPGAGHHAPIETSQLFTKQLTRFLNKTNRYTRGWNKLHEIDGEAGERVINELKDISPDLGRFIIEYSFGDIYNLPLLDNKSKEVATVASLIAQRAINEMKVHFNGALNSGCTITEVKELVLHMSAYVGFPKANCAMNTLKEVLEERKAEGINDEQGEETITKDNLSRYDRGSEYLSQLDENQEQLMKDTYDNFSPEMVSFVIEYGYGDIYSRETLDKKYRQIATIAALTTMGNAPSQLNFHIRAGFNIGLTRDEIKEIMLLMSVYAGFPACINGMNMLKEAVNDNKDEI